MGIQLSNTKSFKFPIEKKSHIRFIADDGDQSLTLTLWDKSGPNPDDEPKEIIKAFSFSDAELGLVSLAVTMEDNGSEVTVTIGNGSITEEDDTTYGEKILYGPIGSFDLRDIKAVDTQVNLTRPLPIHFELENLGSGYQLVIIYETAN